jgi:hypothetical protein
MKVGVVRGVPAVEVHSGTVLLSGLWKLLIVLVLLGPLGFMARRNPTNSLRASPDTPSRCKSMVDYSSVHTATNKKIEFSNSLAVCSQIQKDGTVVM